MDAANNGPTVHSRHTVSDTEADIRAIERQIRWECRAVELGVQRYAAQTAQQSLADTAPGIQAMREAVRGMVPAIQALQDLAADKITTNRSRPAVWWWGLTTLSPEKLAVITVRAVLTDAAQTVAGTTPLAHSFTTVCFNIANAVRLELDYENWQEMEKQKHKAAKEAAKETGCGIRPEDTDFAKALLSRVKKVDAAALKRWWSKIGKARSERWSNSEVLQIGSILLECLVDHGGGWFEITVDRIKGGKTARFIKLTEEAWQVMKDINARAELHRNYHMPMLTKPRDWRRVNEAA